MVEAVKKPEYAVRSLTRGLRILSCFAVEHPEWGVSDLSRQLSLDKATVFRLVKTLEAAGFLVSDRGNGKYRVGPALLRIAYVGVLQSELLRRNGSTGTRRRLHQADTLRRWLRPLQPIRTSPTTVF